MNKIRLFILALLLGTGCSAETARRHYVRDINAVIENAIVYKEPCSFTCGKIKNIYENYKFKMK